MQIISIYLASIFLITGISNDFKMEKENIKETIVENYVHGAFNETNIDNFKKAFHPEFAIINVQKDGRYFLFTRDMWEKVLEERKADKSFDYSSIAMKADFRTIDIVEGKACVTLDLKLEEKLVYTDFLLLNKIDEKWVIVSKIYHQY